MKPGSRQMMRLCAWFGLGLCVLVVVLWVGSAGNQLYFDVDISSTPVLENHPCVLANGSLYVCREVYPGGWRIRKPAILRPQYERISIEGRFWGGTTEVMNKNGESCTATEVPLWVVLCGIAAVSAIMWWKSRLSGVRAVQSELLTSRRAKVTCAVFLLMFGLWAASFFYSIHWFGTKWDGQRQAYQRDSSVAVVRQAVLIDWGEEPFYTHWPHGWHVQGPLTPCDIPFELPAVWVETYNPNQQAVRSFRWRVRLPLWFSTVLCAVLMMFFCRRDRNTTWSQCRKCRYELIGNVSGKCPECGAAVPQGLRERLHSDSAPLGDE